MQGQLVLRIVIWPVLAILDRFVVEVAGSVCISIFKYWDGSGPNELRFRTAHVARSRESASSNIKIIIEKP